MNTDRVPTVIDAELVAERPDLTPALPDSGAIPDVAVDINEVLTEEAEWDLANPRRQKARTTYDSRFKAFASSYVSHLRR
ncbi:hypothetical protein [Streptomyces sp. NPDC088789]|uniref:hypothetical protein n=1 Tax=Streptomyces sp. NPDC088789 TaxID=3365899 RepID=UPI0038121036